MFHNWVKWFSPVSGTTKFFTTFVMGLRKVRTSYHQSIKDDLPFICPFGVLLVVNPPCPGIRRHPLPWCMPISSIPDFSKLGNGWCTNNYMGKCKGADLPGCTSFCDTTPGCQAFTFAAAAAADNDCGAGAGNPACWLHDALPTGLNGDTFRECHFRTGPAGGSEGICAFLLEVPAFWDGHRSFSACPPKSGEKHVNPA